MRMRSPLAVICCGLLCTATLVLHAYIRLNPPPAPQSAGMQSAGPPLPPAPQPRQAEQPKEASPEENRAILLKLRRLNHAAPFNAGPPTEGPAVEEDEWIYEARRFVQFRVVHTLRGNPRTLDVTSRQVLAEVPKLEPGQANWWKAVPDDPDLIRGSVRLCWPAPRRFGWVSLSFDRYLPGVTLREYFRMPGAPADTDTPDKWREFKGWPAPALMHWDPFGESVGHPEHFSRGPGGRLHHRPSDELSNGREVELLRWGSDKNTLSLVVRLLTNDDLRVLRSRPADKATDQK